MLTRKIVFDENILTVCFKLITMFKFIHIAIQLFNSSSSNLFLRNSYTRW